MIGGAVGDGLVTSNRGVRIGVNAETGLVSHATVLLLLLVLCSAWCGGMGWCFSLLQIGDPELKRHLISLCTPKFRILRKASKVREGKEDALIMAGMCQASLIRPVGFPRSQASPPPPFLSLLVSVCLPLSLWICFAVHSVVLTRPARKPPRCALPLPR